MYSVLALSHGGIPLQNGKVEPIIRTLISLVILKSSMLSVASHSGFKIKVSNSFESLNRPFATNDHMVQNPPCWRASSLLFPHWDINTKRPEPVKFDLTSSGGIIMSLPSSMTDFVPCGHLLQKVYCSFSRKIIHLGPEIHLIRCTSNKKSPFLSLSFRYLFPITR